MRNHRGMVLQEVCNLEHECALLLFSHFSKSNPKITWERASSELFWEFGMFGSLSRMVRISEYLGLLSDDEIHDLRLLAKLRNMYAHGRERGQFMDDSKATSVLRALKLVENSRTLLSGVTDEGVFDAAAGFLKARIESRRLSLSGT